jgi:hypothetical protein
VLREVEKSAKHGKLDEYMLKYLSLGTSQAHFMQSWGTKIKAHLGQYSGLLRHWLFTSDVVMEARASSDLSFILDMKHHFYNHVTTHIVTFQWKTEVM